MKDFVKRLQRRKEDALEFVVKQYLPLVKGITHKVLSPLGNDGLIEECINDTFLSVWDNAKKFSGDEADFKKWICVVAKYKAVDYYRKQVKENEAVVLVEKHQEGKVWSAEDVAILAENQKEILTLLNELEALDRDIFIMKYLLGYQNIEIADRLELTKAAVDNRLYRGKKRLQEKTRGMTLGGLSL